MSLPRLLLALTAITIITSSGAHGQDERPSAMTFSLFRSDGRPQFDLMEHIYASGEIDDGTTERFNAFVMANKILPGATVLLHSPGGSLAEGIKLGNALRDGGFRTDIGVRGPSEKLKIEPQIERMMTAMGMDPHPPKELPGICLSSCALAYLGGTNRYLLDKSIYGVHRFSSSNAMNDPLDNAQIVSGVIVAYMQKMGVDLKLYALMTMASPTDIVVLNRDDLITLKVVTGSTLKDDWALKSLPQGIYLVGSHVDERGTSKFIFTCNDKKGLVGMAIIPAGSEKNAAFILSEATGAGYFIDGKIQRLKSDNELSKIQKGAEVDALWKVSAEDVEAITSGKTNTGFALLTDFEEQYAGLMIGYADNGRDMIRSRQ